MRRRHPAASASSVGLRPSSPDASAGGADDVAHVREAPHPDENDVHASRFEDRAERALRKARAFDARGRECRVQIRGEGLDALREYAKTPARFTPLKSDPLLRLLLCDLVGEPITRASLTTLREDIADLKERLIEGEATALSLPHRSKYLLLVNEFLQHYLDLHLDLVNQVERDFASEG